MNIGKLQMQIAGAFVWLTILTGIFGTALWVFSGDFTDVRKDVATVNQAVAMQGVTINDMDKTLTRIEAKLDNSNTALKPASAVKAKR